jgi:tetratricopeptide (TPR) repeat protein
MKATERHHLKQNEFAETARRAFAAVTERRRQVLVTALAALVVVVGIAGFMMFRKAKADAAGAMLGVAMAIAQAPITPPSTLPGAAQAPGTYTSEAARSEAALKAYQDVIATHPSTPAALTARYEAAGELLDLGRHAEAETFYSEVAASGSAVYASVAQLGVAQAKVAAGSYDEAVTLLSDLSAARDGSLPVDGVLMQLGQAYEKAGKAQEARAAYQRVIDEFADSAYAFEARQQLATLN